MNESSAQKTHEEIQRSLKTPGGRILITAYTYSSIGNEAAQKLFPQIVNWPKGASLGNLLQVATVLSAVLQIERYLGTRNYAPFHASLVNEIVPSMRNIYVPPLQGLACFLLQLDRSSLAAEEIPDLTRLLSGDEVRLANSIGLWLVLTLKGIETMADPADIEVASALTHIAYHKNARMIFKDVLSDKDLLMGIAEQRGSTMRRGPAGLAYEKAQDFEDLLIAAGEHLALHACMITVTLQVSGFGSAALKEIRLLPPNKRRQSLQANNDAFCACAFVELGSVREMFKGIGRWPELSPFLDQIFCMACSYLARSEGLDEQEAAMLREQSIIHLIDFQVHQTRSYQEQLARILRFAPISEERERKSLFTRMTTIQPANLEPTFLLEAYDKFNRT